jgi:putative transposase
MYKAIKVRLYPTVKQKQMLDDHFNAYRFCYNLCLEYKSLMWNNYKISKSGYDMQAELFEIRKQTPWLKKCKAECIRDAALNVENSYKSFFKGKGFPVFKSKNGVQSFLAYQDILSKNNKIKFFGELINYKTSDKYVEFLECNKIKRVVFKRDMVGNYWAACLIELPDLAKFPLNLKTVGIDLGIKDLLITSDGAIYPNNKYLINSHFKLKKLQRKFAKTQKSGKNRDKLRIRIAKVYRKSVRQKEHYYHQITNELIRDNQTIVLETLRIKNMMGNRSLARNISDASWGLLISQLEYKAHWYGRQIVRIDTFYPSTKTCSSCGLIKDMPLKERMYNCECGLSLDRDINAAINIRNSGLKIPGVSVEGVGYEPIEAESNSLILTI